MTTSTRDFDAEIAAIMRERDIASLEASKAVQAALGNGKVATLAADLSALIADMPAGTVAAQQAGHIINCMRNGKSLIDGEVSRIQALVDAQAVAEEGEAA